MANFRFTTVLISLLSLFTHSTALNVPNTIYVIRNAENAPGTYDGFSTVGSQRAVNCILPLMNTAAYNIGKIITCAQANVTGSNACHSAYATGILLNNALSTGIDVDCRVDDDDVYGFDDDDGLEGTEDCLRRKIHEYNDVNSAKSILIIWDEVYIEDILGDIGIDGPAFPVASPDTIFTVKNGLLVSRTSMQCSGIDSVQPYGTLLRRESGEIRGAEEGLWNYNGTEVISESETRDEGSTSGGRTKRRASKRLHQARSARAMSRQNLI